MIVPKDFIGVASGGETPCLDKDLLDGKECFRYVTKRPIDLASLNVGKGLKIDRGTVPGLDIPVAVSAWP